MNFKKISIIALALIFLASLWAFNSTPKDKKTTKKSIYDYTVKNIDGKEVKMSKYKGKVLLIVNVASECGFTPQYEGLQKLYSEYKDKDFVILGFPCNQFGKQEPGTNAQIKEFCSSKFHVTFPMFDKIDVNGEKTAPLYQYLKSELPGVLGSENIKWNFTKFLIGKNGKPIKRYASNVKPQSIEEDVKAALK